jgi:hypothetical protein
MPDPTEASRRAAEGARVAAEATRGLVGDSADVSRKLFDAWVEGAEAALRASFELQNAGLNASLSLLESTAAAERAALQQWDAAAHQAQQAALEAFRAQVRAAQRASESAQPKR